METKDATAPGEVPALLDVKHTRERAATFDLEWPVTVNGKLLSAVTLQRLTTKEIADFYEVVKDHEGEIRYPIFRYPDGSGLIPDDVFDELDDDDVVMLNKRAVDFLPRRFQRATASSLDTGVSIEPTSGA